MKTKKGALLGKYYKTAAQAVKAYNIMSEVKRKHMCVITFNSGESMIVGNEQADAIKL